MAGIVITQVVDERGARDWHAVDDATRRVDHEELPADPLPEVLARLRLDDALGERVELWVLREAGEPVAAAEVGLPTRDNLDTAHVDVRVRPDRRRRGLGTQLLAHCLDRARAHGRTRVIGQVPEPLADPGAAPGPAFARAAGAARALNQIRRLLDVHAVGDDLLDRLRTGAQAAAGDYDLLQWVDRVPEPDAPAMAALNAQMALDVPREDLEWEPEVWDVARLRASEDELLDRGRRVVATAARHRAGGELVGFSNIAVSAVRPRVGFQFDTLVVAAHRGHRLGMLMKAVNLQLLRAELPATRYLNTWNAEVNDHMVAINDALGFRPVDRWRDWQLRLP